MTVIANNARNQYVATNAQTIFNYNFEIEDESNIQVYQRAAGSTPDDAADLLVLTTDYTVTGVGVNSGGTIILNSGATSGDIVTIQGAAPAERDTAFSTGGVIQAANLNNEFDNDVLIYQTILATLNFLVPKYQKSAVVNDFDLVLPILEANQSWAMNDNNDEIIGIVALQGSQVENIDFVVGTANSLVPAAQVLGNLTTGLLFNTTVAGVGTLSTIAQSNFADAPTNTNITSMTGLTGLLRQPTAIADTAGNPVLGFGYAGIPTDYIEVNNGANNDADIRVISTQTNASFAIYAKGTGGVEIGSLGATTVPFAISKNSSAIKFYFSVPVWTSTRTLTFPDADVTLTAGTTLPDDLTSSHIWVGDASNKAADVQMTGDGAMANTGAITISKIGGQAVSLGGGLTTGGAVTFSGVHSFTATLTNNTNITFPITGTLLNNALSSANFYVGSAGGVATGVAMSGDASLANTGAVTVGSIGGIGITLGGTFSTASAFSTSGAFSVVQTYTGATNVTFPTTGTLATTSSLSAYLPLAGGTMSGTINMGGNTITNLPLPTVSSEPATKAYVDNVVAGSQMACLVATDTDMPTWTYSNGALGVGATLTAPSNGASTFDGVVPADGNRILVLFQTTNPAWQGSYTIVQGTAGTPTVLTRSTDWDQAAEMNPGDQFAVVQGTLYGASQWMFSQVNAITVGTTALTFQQIAGAGALLKANNLSDIPNAATARSNLGLAIGTNVQAYDAGLQSISGLTTAANTMLYTTALDTYAVITPGNSSVLISSAGGVPSWSTTLPAGLTIPGYQASLSPAALTRVDDTNVTLTLGGTPSTSLLQAVSLTMGWSGQLSVARGGSGAASFTAYSVICAGTTSTSPFQNVSGVGTSGQVLTSNGAGTLPTWQAPVGTGTVSSGTQNQLAWYAANGTTVSGLTTANSGVLVTSSGGVPSISSTLPSGLTILLPNIVDASGNNILTFASNPSAVNYLTIVNGPAAGTPPLISAVGTDTNIDVWVQAKGTGFVRVLGNNTTYAFGMYSGTTQQHLTLFAAPNTSATRTITLPDGDVTLVSGTVLVSGGALGTPSSGNLSNATNYSSANLTNGGYVLLGTATASSSANLSFTSLSGANYAYFELVFDHVIPATNNVACYLTISTGSGFLATNYYNQQYRFTSAASAVGGDTAAAQFTISPYSDNLSNTAAYGFNGTVKVNCLSTVATKGITYQLSGLSRSGGADTRETWTGGGNVATNSAAIDGLKIAMSSGNIASGTIYLYGVKNS